MSGRGQLVALDGVRFQALLGALEDALSRGRRGALARLARACDVEASEALEEIAALPVRSCSAVREGALLDEVRCTRDEGCPAADECPVAIPSSAPVGATMRASAAGKLLRAIVASQRIESLSAPVDDFSALGGAVRELLAKTRAFEPGAPPRARTSLTLVDAAIERGGPLGVVRRYLTAEEAEQVAAFVPPGSGHRSSSMESWLRRVACHEAAVCEWNG